MDDGLDLRVVDDGVASGIHKRVMCPIGNPPMAFIGENERIINHVVLALGSYGISADKVDCCQTGMKEKSWR